MSRHGRIDQIGELGRLDMDALFGDTTGRYPRADIARLAFKDGNAYYRGYVERYRFSDLGHVADLGGGLGRWAVFLAEVNDRVTVLDRHPYLVDIGPKLARHLGFGNLSYVRGGVEELPFRDHAFDAVWMSGVIFLVNRDRALAEVARVLRPGGRCLMGSFNAPGRIVHWLAQGFLKGGFDDPVCRQGLDAARLARGAFDPGPPNYGTRGQLAEILAPFGLEPEADYPIETFQTHALDPEDQALVAHLPTLADRFERDESVRTRLVKRYRHIMRGMELDLWFSARKTGAGRGVSGARRLRPPACWGPGAEVDLDELRSLDLCRFNDGANPYGPDDVSVVRAFRDDLPGFYRDFVRRRTGFTGAAHVLDLMCGFGRWAPFLAECNGFVTGLERVEGCTRVAHRLCRHFGLDNTAFLAGDVMRIREFPDEHFDYVWIWSALQYVHRGRVLAQVYRILRRGGRLLIGNYNGPGLMVQFVVDGARNGTLNTGAAAWALSALVRGEDANGLPSYLTPGRAGAVMEAFGFQLVAAAWEPGLDLSVPSGVLNNVSPQMTPQGLPPTLQLVAEKPHDAPPFEELQRRRLSGHGAQRTTASRVLEESAPPSPATLAAWMLAGDTAQREAVGALLAGRGEAAVPCLLGLLETAAPDVGRFAADLLVQIGAPGLPALFGRLAEPRSAATARDICSVMERIAPRFRQAVQTLS